METVYFTLAAIFLYVGADWMLRRIEVAASRRLQHRNIVFFLILLIMALTSFALIRHFAGP